MPWRNMPRGYKKQALASEPTATGQHWRWSSGMSSPSSVGQACRASPGSMNSRLKSEAGEFGGLVLGVTGGLSPPHLTC